MYSFLLQGKKKKTSSNENQQWEQWKQKDTMVMYKLFIIYFICLSLAQ